MMFPGWGMGGWMMVSYGFVVLLFLVGIVVALVALSRRTGRSGPQRHPQQKSCSLNATPAVKLTTTSTSSG
jgi:uncharacterized membrane protein